MPVFQNSKFNVLFYFKHLTDVVLMILKTFISVSVFTSHESRFKLEQVFYIKTRSALERTIWRSFCILTNGQAFTAEQWYR